MTPPEATLITRDGATVDRFRRLGAAEIAGHPAVLVPFGELAAARLVAGAGLALGVEIPNTVRAEALGPYLGQLALIAVRFPGFSDGRGFSIAKALRAAGYADTLRAVGPLIADQFAYALACGFDEVEPGAVVLARQPADQWLTALGAMHATYQRGYHRSGNILERRKTGRDRPAPSGEIRRPDMKERIDV